MLRSIRTIRNIPRIKDISLVLFKFGLDQIAVLLGAPLRLRIFALWKRAPDAPTSQPERLRLAFQELGPTFIKLGQLIANRPDLFPPEYVEEFSKLESRVQPMPFPEIRAGIEASLGVDPEQHFKHVDETPLASASIAQIHRATTRDGEQVILKVQKPGVENIIDRDLEILGLIAEALSNNAELEIYDPEGIVAEVKRAFERELNYTFERNALDRVRKSFEDDPVLVVPKTYPHLSSQRLLVMEYFDGMSLRNHAAKGEEAERLARECTRILFEMIFRDGYFHADPHASNIMVLSDGRLGWVDFGSMGLLTEEMRLRLVKLLRAMVNRNYDGVARQVLKLGRPQADTNVFAFTQDLASRMDPYFGLTVEEIDFGSLFNTVMELARDHRISIAPAFISMTRCLLLMQGVAARLAPDFNTMEELEPLIKRYVVEQYKPQKLVEDAFDRTYEMIASISEYPQHISDILRTLAQGRFQVDTQLSGMDRFTRRFESNTNHIVQALIVSSLLVSSSLVLTSDIGPGLWGVSVIGVLGYCGAGLLGAWILLSILRRN